MNTLTNGLLKRALSILLVTIMVFSLGIVGITSTSAAEVELAETGWDGNEQMYCWNSLTDSWETSTDDNIKMTAGGGSNDLNNCISFTNVPTSESFCFAIYDSTNNQVVTPANSSEQTVTLNNGGEYWWNNIEYLQLDNGEERNDRCWEVSMSNVSSTFSHVTVTIEFYMNQNSVYIKLHSGTNKTTTINSVTASCNPSSDIEQGDTVQLITTTSITNPSENTDYVYTITKPDGSTLVNTYTSSSSSGYTLNYTPDNVGSYEFSVTVKNNNKELTSDPVSFVVSPPFVLTVEALIDGVSTVYEGTKVDVFAQTNADTGAEITYVFKDPSGDVLPSNGEFVTIDTTGFDAGDYTYTVEATIAGYPSASDDFVITVLPFDELILTPSYPESVECGADIKITVDANTSENITFTLTDKTTSQTLTSENIGEFSIHTTDDDENTTRTFVISAVATVNGQEYAATTYEFTVQIVPISTTHEITIYFKSSSTFGYAPIASIENTYETKDSVPMEKYQYIRSNETNTADYWWYSISTEVADSSPKTLISIVGGRYGMEARYTINVDPDVNEYWLGIDDLNNGKPADTVDLTYETNPDIRNFCESAAHMIYDEKLDAPETLAMVSSTYVLIRNGDVNCDGKINVRDATLLQKKLANISVLSEVGTKVADVNSDGNITIKDATAIQKQIAGL